MDYVLGGAGNYLVYGHLAKTGYDVREYLERCWPDIEAFRRQYMLPNTEQKIDVIIEAEMKKRENIEWTYIQFYRHSKYFSTHQSDYKDSIIERLVRSIEEFQENSSGWKLSKILCLNMYVNNYDPLLRRNRYGGSNIELPPFLKNKKAVLNVKNTNGNCFLISLIAAIKHKEYRGGAKCEAATYLKFKHLFNMNGIELPFNLKNFNKFHSLNRDYAINIFAIENERLSVLRRPSNNQYAGRIVINVLYLEGIDELGHFCAITNFNRLMNSKVVNGKYSPQRFWCSKCIGNFPKRQRLEKHMETCYSSNEKILLPPQDEKFFFKSYGKTMQQSHVIYADFECLIDSNGKHIPIACGYIRWSQFEDYFYNDYCGEDCVNWFLESMKKEMKYVQSWSNVHCKKNHGLTKEQRDSFLSQSTVCHMCHKKLNKDIAVVDHCHLTGEIRGACCKKCNSILKLSYNSLKVIIHNLKNYDGHLICKYGLSKQQNSKVSVLASSSEKYITFNVNFYGIERFRLNFIDSCLHLNASLSTLFSNLEFNSRVITQELKNEYPSLTNEVVMRKGVYPYEYMDDVLKLEDSELPKQENFYNSLINKNCCDEDYNVAKMAWEQFDCKTMKDYMMSYLKMDVRQLADIFNNYVNICKEYYGLVPYNYVSLPSLSLDAALKSSKIALDLLMDMSMVHDFKSGIRGGMVFLNKHRSTANIPNHESFNELFQEKRLLVVDANSLYGHAMQMSLPKGNFKYIEEFDFENPDERYGYYFIVDLIYPAEIHDDTADLPLAPLHMLTHDSLLTNYMKEFEKRERPSRKLMLTQFDKKEYKLFYPLLKFYLRMGMKVSKIHRIIQFDQEPFLKTYIDFNSKMRAKATSIFEKNFFKLLNNSAFGKFCENLTKRVDFQLCTNEKQLKKALAHPRIKTSYIFDENLTGHTLERNQVVMDRPLAIGTCILDLSKLIMYQLFYDRIKPSLPGVRLLASDTDSFFLEIPNKSYEAIIECMWNYLDTSNYPSSHPYYSCAHKTVPGYLKDEGCGNDFLDAVFLKPKMYSLLSSCENYDKKTAKGVGKTSIAELTHDHYVRALNEAETFSVVNKRIGNKLHDLYTISTTKTALSSYDNKRAWLDHEISLPFGHYSLNQTLPLEKSCKPLSV